MPETKATLRYLRTSAYKVREVLALIRGLDIEEARHVLTFCDRGAARDVLKVLNSAVANAEHTMNLPADELSVSVAYADEGPTIKRWRPRARGRATRIRKRTSHITIVVARLSDEQLQIRRRKEAAAGGGQRRRGVLPGRRRRTEEKPTEKPAATQAKGQTPAADETAPAPPSEVPAPPPEVTAPPPEVAEEAPPPSASEEAGPGAAAETEEDKAARYANLGRESETATAEGTQAADAGEEGEQK